MKLTVTRAIVIAQKTCKNKKWLAWADAWLHGSDRSAAWAAEAREAAGSNKAAALASHAALHAAEAISDPSSISSWVSKQAALHAARASLSYSMWKTWPSSAQAAHRAGAPGESRTNRKDYHV